MTRRSKLCGRCEAAETHMYLTPLQAQNTILRAIGTLMQANQHRVVHTPCPPTQLKIKLSQ